MCPRFPHCATGADPCAEIIGSNARAMGGAAGRCDAMAAAVESQAAGGVLHIHLCMIIHIAMQFRSLQQIAEFLRDKMLTAEALTQVVCYVRCAAYPDAAAHEESRGKVEESMASLRGRPQSFALAAVLLDFLGVFARGVVARVSHHIATCAPAIAPPHSPADQSAGRPRHGRATALAIQPSEEQ